MSTPMTDATTRRARRQFADESKASAMCPVLVEGETVGAERTAIAWQSLVAAAK